MANSDRRGDGEKCYVNSHFETRAMRVSCPRNSRYIVAIKMGRRLGGTYRRIGESACRRLQSVVSFVETSWSLQPCRKVVLLPQTPIRQYADPPTRFRGRRPIFIATLWAGASWLFFRVARSTRMTQIWVLRSRLEKQPTDLRQYTCYFGDRTLGHAPAQYGIALHA
jgi:hypothetical protein